MTLARLLIPSDVRRAIESEPGSDGVFTLRWSAPDRCGIVVASGGRTSSMTPFPATGHFLQYADFGPQGSWHHGTDEHSTIWREAAGRGCAIDVEELRQRLPGDLWHVGSGVAYFVLIVTPRPPEAPEWTAWAVSEEQATPVGVDVERDDEGLATLGDHWPNDRMKTKHVAIVGIGSIGSATAQAIANHGVGRLTLVDPDRLEFHNLVRHQLPRSDVGRHKAVALAEKLEKSFPDLSVQGMAKNVLWNTDEIRDAFSDADVIIGATDGVVPRRTIVHIARRLGIPAMLGCVLLDGALGEIMRFRPVQSHGCLECRRRATAGLFALDASMENPYGTGSAHLPMTAIGTDLEIVARLLAKASISTLLEAEGFSDQRLPGESAIVGLRPTGAAPSPYDISRAGDIRWLPADPPLEGCPTCSIT
ncbi:Sulfur carrier protein ThiS adenylyltransferase [Microbacterium sp. Bi98]|nr:Sulfur carrier protein ThiS adenylyltransferase [Microbacterium sp. Bi98]